MFERSRGRGDGDLRSRFTSRLYHGPRARLEVRRAVDGGERATEREKKRLTSR